MMLDLVNCPHCGLRHITSSDLDELRYMQREAPGRGGYMYEIARPAFEQGKYRDAAIAHLLSCGAIYPHQDPNKGWVPRSTRREKTTAEVAKMIGATPDLVKMWKKRGFLKYAPHGVHGAGRNNACYWSEEAQREIIEFAKTRNFGPNADAQRLSTPTRKNRPLNANNRASE